MEIIENIEQQTVQYSSQKACKSGANWFFWLGGFSIINSLIVYYFGTPNSMVAFGVTRWLDGTSGRLTAEGFVPPMHTPDLVVNLIIAAAFAGFGYVARKGSDLAFVVGIFLYVIDSLLVIGLRDFFAFGFHLVGLYFIARGLLGSRHMRENATTI